MGSPSQTYVDEDLLRQLFGEEPEPEPEAVAPVAVAPLASLEPAAASPEPVEAEPELARPPHAEAETEAESATAPAPLPEFAQFYNAGVSWLEAGETERAISALRQSLQAAPAEGEPSRTARMALGMALLEGQQPDAALEYFEALGSDPEGLRARIGALLALNRAGEARQTAEALLLQAPGDEFGLTARLVACIASGDAEGAEQSAVQLHRMGSPSRAALETLVSLTSKRSAFAAAAEYARELEQHWPELDFASWMRLAGVYLAAGRFADALSAAGKAGALQPGSAAAELLRAQALGPLGDRGAARQAYEAATRDGKADPDSLWNLALLCEEDGELNGACEALARLTELNPACHDAWLRMASLLAAQDRFADAERTLTDGCLAARPEWPEALFLLGVVQSKLDRGDDAQEAILKALSLKPDEIAWIEHLQAIALDRNDPLVALDCHERLVAKQAGTPESAFNLGVLLQQESEPELAAKCFIRALEQRPEFGDALLNLGHALNDLGREDEAKACWSKAVLLDPALAAGYFDC